MRLVPRSFLRFAPRTIAILSASLILSACAGMATAPAKVSDGALTDPGGKTLYTFDKDVSGSGKSVCNGPCATNWPAFTAAGDAALTGDYTVVTRDDGTKQWAFRGKPLYTFAKDAKPGDRNGDGFANNIWHIARP
jgi:predicted lipoprotein with Yx(FWY)xxD motif